MSNDYTQAALGFKVRKAVRYIRLYGLSRTFVKVRGQYHMRATERFQGPIWRNASCEAPDATERSVAIIGCGNYAFSNIAYYLQHENRRFLRAAFDIEKSRALSLCRVYGGAYAVSDWREILTDQQVKIVYIASNHASHAEYAIACMEAGKHVHIEKPHAVTNVQLDRLIEAMKRYPASKVFLGFNRPKSQLFRALQGKLEAEPGSLMINWFVAGHEIPDDHWYFDDKEGGRVLGNLCHWTDLTLHLVSLERAFPCKIVPATPAGAKSDFVVSANFADGSCATITFSAKGHTFEGVREVLNLHKGNLLANLTDFETLTLDIVEKKATMRLLNRDHGHRQNIIHSIRGATRNEIKGEDARYVAATGRFVLAVRRAIDSGESVVLAWDDIVGASV